MEDETVRNRIRAEIALERRCPVHERDPADSAIGLLGGGDRDPVAPRCRLHRRQRARRRRDCQGVKKFSNWPTIPQLYVKGEFAGGCDIVREMYQSGELQKLLLGKGVTVGNRSEVDVPRLYGTDGGY